MKKDYKQKAKGRKAFKEKYPTGNIAPPVKATKQEIQIKEVKKLRSLFHDIFSAEAAVEYLRLLNKYPESHHPTQMKFACDVFKHAIGIQETLENENRDGFTNPHWETLEKLKHPKLSGHYWKGEGIEMLRWLCVSKFETRDIQGMLESAGFTYTRQQINRTKKKLLA